MPRKPRFYAPNVTCHVIARGNNRNACFFAEQDYQYYLECLTDACRKYKVDLHAYVLMTNHVHLLLTPKTCEGISQVMQSIGRRYVQTVNFRQRRTGTLWEGRHRSSPIDSERYFLTCCRYIELNPVRANMVSHPADYQWSSYHQNAGLQPLTNVSAHEIYMRLGRDSSRRKTAYRALFEFGLSSQALTEIRQAAACSMLLGDAQFKLEIESVLGRSVGHVERGRPRRSTHK